MTSLYSCEPRRFNSASTGLDLAMLLGKHAFFTGVPLCPYSSETMQMAWFEGWYSAYSWVYLQILHEEKEMRAYPNHVYTEWLAELSSLLTRTMQNLVFIKNPDAFMHDVWKRLSRDHGYK